MADDELQALLDRLHKDGVEKAEADAKEMLNAAAVAARKRVDAAEAEAEKIVAAAREEARLLEEKGREALRQAARNVRLSLRNTLEQRLSAVVRAGAGTALTPEVLGTMLKELARAYGENGGKVERVTALVDEKALKEMEAGFLGALGDDLRKRTELKPMPGLAGGFQLVFNGETVTYDFSDTAIAEAMQAFLRPKLAELLAEPAE